MSRKREIMSSFPTNLNSHFSLSLSSSVSKIIKAISKRSHFSIIVWLDKVSWLRYNFYINLIVDLLLSSARAIYFYNRLRYKKVKCSQNKEVYDIIKKMWGNFMIYVKFWKFYDETFSIKCWNFIFFIADEIKNG